MLDKYVFSEKKNLVLTTFIDLIEGVIFFWIKKDRLYPLTYALVFPLQALYKLILKISPKTARFLKKEITTPLRSLRR